MLVRLAVQLVCYLRIKNRAVLIAEDEASIYHVDRDILPFSFGKAIFVNPALHAPHELREIMAHERVHVRQRHTFDILFAELLCVLNWYNPAAWLIRHAIRQNLEFIADRAVLADGTDAQNYQYLLLKVAGVPAFRLANQFNFSSLKERIIMMNRHRSAGWYLTRFLYLVPVTLILLSTFRTDIVALASPEPQVSPTLPNQNEDDPYVYLAGILIDGATGEPMRDFPLMQQGRKSMYLKGEEPEKPQIIGTIRTDDDGFYYWKIDSRDQVEQVRGYSLESIGPSKNELAIHVGVNVYKDQGTHLYHGFGVLFHTPELMDKLRRDYHFIRVQELRENGIISLEPAAIKKYLLAKTSAFAAEHQLKLDFKKAHWKLRKTITKFRNAYFNKERELIGYEDDIAFYLDGKPVEYQKVNEAFAREPYQIMSADAGLKQHRGLEGKVFYTTFEAYKDTPPAGLAAPQNVTWLHPDDFDLTRLQDEPYMLDGFRQTFGTSSNLTPLPEEITRVAIFKGALARYYDKGLDKLWWIETRPADEVQGRPDFVAE